MEGPCSCPHQLASKGRTTPAERKCPTATPGNTKRKISELYLSLALSCICVAVHSVMAQQSSSSSECTLKLISPPTPQKKPPKPSQNLLCWNEQELERITALSLSNLTQPMRL